MMQHVLYSAADDTPPQQSLILCLQETEFLAHVQVTSLTAACSQPAPPANTSSPEDRLHMHHDCSCKLLHCSAWAFFIKAPAIAS
jgi:hypothetical protein